MKGMGLFFKKIHLKEEYRLSFAGSNTKYEANKFSTLDNFKQGLYSHCKICILYDENDTGVQTKQEMIVLKR